MARAIGIRAYAASRQVPVRTVGKAVARGAIPLTPSGVIDVIRADRRWLPYWRPATGRNPYAPMSDPAVVEAQADAELRRAWAALGVTEAEQDAALAAIERALSS